jgi:hypothetical protein
MNTTDLRTNTPIMDRHTQTHAAPHGRARAGLVAGVCLTVAAALAGCSSGALSSGSLAIPSVNVSAAASMGAQVALGVLDRVDAAITSSETSGGLSTENASTLKGLTATIRTSLETGDLSEARTGFADLAAKVEEVASTLSGDAGTKLRDAIAALKAAVGS